MMLTVSKCLAEAVKFSQRLFVVKKPGESLNFLTIRLTLRSFVKF